MKKNVHVLFAVACMVAVSVSACKKDDKDNTPNTPTAPANSVTVNGTAQTGITVTCQTANDNYYYQSASYTGGSVTLSFRGANPPAAGTYTVGSGFLPQNNQVVFSHMNGQSTMFSSGEGQVTVTTINGKASTTFTNVRVQAVGGTGPTEAMLSGTITCN